MKISHEDPNLSDAQANEKKERKLMGGSFAVSLIFHATILLIIGSIIIVPGVVKEMSRIAAVTPPPTIPEAPQVVDETPEAKADDGGGNPISDVPETSSTSTSTDANMDALTVASPVSTGPSMNAMAGASAVPGAFNGGKGGSGGGTGTGVGTGSGPGVGRGKATFFGSTEKVESALVGRFFDLKQTSARTPTPFATAPWTSCADCENYFKLQEDFIKGGWDDGMLSKYFHAPKPLYATQFWVPNRPSPEAPKAFGLEKIVQGGYWLAHYKGKVVPPKDGTYRFVGFADCQMVVGVNKKVVLVSGWFAGRPKNLLPEDGPLVGRYRGGEGGLRAGTWLELKKSEPVDLDVLWGDQGGDCCCFLQVEEQGATYQMENGQPILPMFQLGQMPLDIPMTGGQPKYATGFAPWKGVK